MSKKQQQAFCRLINKDQLQFLSDLCFDIYSKKIKISDKTKNELRKQSKNFKTLADPKISFKRKKDVLMSGGYLSSLFTILSTSLLPIIFEKLAKKNE